MVNPNSMEKVMTSVVVAEITGGGGHYCHSDSSQESRERGVLGQGNVGLEEITSGGNKGGQMGKDRREREVNRGELGMVAPMQVGHLEKMMHYCCYCCLFINCI
jgi:hypothetical protein